MEEEGDGEGDQGKECYREKLREVISIMRTQAETD